MCNDARYYKCNLHVNGEISNSRFDYIEMSKRRARGGGSNFYDGGAMDLANPLFTLEFIHQFISTSMLQISTGAVLLGGLVGHLQMPHSFSELRGKKISQNCIIRATSIYVLTVDVVKI